MSVLQNGIIFVFTQCYTNRWVRGIKPKSALAKHKANLNWAD